MGNCDVLGGARLRLQSLSGLAALVLALVGQGRWIIPLISKAMGMLRRSRLVWLAGLMIGLSSSMAAAAPCSITWNVTNDGRTGHYAYQLSAGDNTACSTAGDSPYTGPGQETANQPAEGGGFKGIDWQTWSNTLYYTPPSPAFTGTKTVTWYNLFEETITVTINMTGGTPPPTVTAVSPPSGPVAGTGSVTITGANLTGATAVKFGANIGTITSNSATSITATVPSGSAGTVDVTVTTPGGTSATSAADRYTYVAAPTVTSVSPTSGPSAGGTSVTISGTNFTGTTSVRFGATSASAVTFNSATSITATSPAGSGTVDITVTTPGGTSATSASDRFTYTVPAPAVSGVSPGSGPTAGGTSVTISGSNFTGASAVRFGATNAASFTVNSASSIIATSPAGSPGTFDITVTTAGGTSATGAADQFTYVVAAAPVANNVSATVGYGSSSNPITLSITDGAATGVAVAAAPVHGTASASGTTITYTPTASYSGTDSFTYTATNGSGTSSPATVSITVSPATVSYAPSSPSAGAIGSAYSQSLASASGGTAPYSYSLMSGSLPAGLSLSSSGTLSGTPTRAGSFSFRVTATDSSTGAGTFSTTSATLTLAINPPALSLAPGTLPAASVGASYSRSITASGGTGPYGYAVTSGTLPAGLTLASDGTLSGTPTTGGTFNFTVTATDSSTGAGAPFSAGHAYSLTVTAPTVSVSPGSLPAASVGASYSSSITASGGTGPYSYALTSGALPAGLTLASNGMLSGTPTASGTFNFTITATDSAGAPNTGSQAYTLNLGVPTLAINPGNGSSFNGNVGSSFSQTFGPSGGLAPYHFGALVITAGTMPTGLSFNTATGTLAGTPIIAGTVSFQLTASDSTTGTGPATQTGSYTLTIAAPTIALSPASLPNPSVGTTYSQSVSASGGTGPYTYAVTANALPAGLSLNSTTGAITGTPTAAGSFSFTVTATDANGFTKGQGYSVTVGAPTIVVSPASLPSANVASSYNQTITAAGGIAPYTFAITAGAVPHGMTLSGSGAITGTPTAAGSFSFTVTATDANGFTKGQGYSVTVGAPSIAVAPASLPAGRVGSAYSQTASASGGTAPYVFGISAGSLPTGLSLDSSSGAITGTPTAVGTFNFTIQATDSTGGGAPFSGSKAYTVTINPLAPVAGALSVTVPYNTAIPIDLAASISGGAASGVTVSTAPAHGTTTVSAAVVTYTPTAGYSGTDSFSYTATNASGTSVATVSLIVNPQATIAGAVSATVAFNSSNNPIALKLAGGVAVSVAVATAPSHGTASVSGTTISYTPTAGYSGTDRFSYTATNASGQSAPATVDITVNPALPAPQPATTTIASNSGSTVIPLVIDGGPVVSVTVVAPPRHGTLNVTGLGANRKVLASVSDAGSGAPSVSYTPNPGFVGTDSFSYTASNAAGTSAAATVTLQVTPPPPVLAPVSATTVSGAPVTLDVTAGASGGPFTGLVLVTPPASGTAEVRGLTIVYTPPPAFAGVVTIGYALSNAWGTTRGTATVTVNARPDPSKDPEVTGLLAAQTDATKRFARAQLDNFNRRLESLHGKGWGDSDFGLSASNFGLHADRDADPELSKRGRSNRLADASGRSKSKVDAGPSEASGEADNAARNELAFWIGGGLDFGQRDAVTGQDKFRFSTDGISVGSDYRLNDLLSVGVGGGFSRDVSDVGSNGSKSEGRSGTVALYASLRPTETLFVDGVLGYGWLNFDLDRYITDSGANASGSRNGRQLFGLLAAGYEYRNGSWLVSPYGRLDMMSATLDGYTESAPGVSALTYAGQDVRMSSGKLGVRGETSFDLDFGRLTPRMRVEYQHQFEGSDDAYLAYADLAAYGLGYVAHLAPTQRNQWIIEAGGKIALRGEMTFSFDYSSTLNNSSGYTQAVRLMLGVPF